MGFWGLGHRVENDMDIYLQIEQKKICFKMSVPDKEERSKTRNKFYNLLIAEASKFDLEVRKPKRFGSGRHMTFAVLDTDVFDGKNSIDLQQVNKLMDEIKTFINHSVSQYESQISQ